MTEAVLTFNEQIDRLGEFTLMLVTGILLGHITVPTGAFIWFVPLLLLGIRPLTVFAGLAGAKVPMSQKCDIGWFGIRGIGSLYDLLYAASQGMDDEGAQSRLAIVLHGISVTPWLRYRRAMKTA